MKKIIMTFLVLVSSLSFADEGVVIVLEAPLLKSPALSAVVLQTLRKGARVYVPHEFVEKIQIGEKVPSYIQTFDRVGNISYVPSKYIKIITNDHTEARMPINYPGLDPTDYRLEEPIPATYPFDDSAYLRGSVAMSLGNNIKAPYDYKTPFLRQNFSTEKGAKVVVTRKISFDKFDRSYFGLIAAVNTVNNTIDFQNTNTATENRSSLRVGPIITFDAYKTEKWRFTLGTGFTYNYHKSTITMADLNGNSEQRIFSGYSLSPFTNTMIQLQDVLPKIDLIAGADINLYLPHKQTTQDEIMVPELWDPTVTNQISTGLEPQVSFFLGLQVKY